jgi:hypothetical protein
MKLDASENSTSQVPLEGDIRATCQPRPGPPFAPQLGLTPDTQQSSPVLHRQDGDVTFPDTRAMSLIEEYVFRPLLAKNSLAGCSFVVADVARRTHLKEFTCLRELENALRRVARVIIHSKLSLRAY